MYSRGLTFGLVIQGPLTSRGFDGEAKYREFDCIENIVRIQSKFGHLFESLVISTWEDEDPARLEQLKQLGFRIVLCSSSDFSIPWHPDNRFLQYHSSLKGIAAIQDEVKYVVKCRTDAYLDLDLLLQEFTAVLRDSQDYSLLKVGPIHSLFFFKYRPLAVADFVLLGESKLLLRFFKSQFDLAFGSAHPSQDWPEGDSVRKFLFSLRSELPSRRAEEYFPSFSKDFFFDLVKAKEPIVKPPETTVRVWETALRCVFSFSTEQVVNTLEIRGKKKQLDHSKVSFYSDWLLAKIDFPAYLGICDWERPRVGERSWFFDSSEIRDMRISSRRRMWNQLLSKMLNIQSKIRAIQKSSGSQP